MSFKLPIQPTDDQIIFGPYNSRYKYYAELNQWVEIGKTADLSIVNDIKDGLVSPALADHINNITQLYGNILNFKIWPSINSYYYLLKSKDFLFNINGNMLSIEINKSKLYYKLLGRACQGVKGIKGEKGDTGISGSSANPEIPIPYSLNNNIIETDISVVLTIDTEISIRLNDNGGNNIEIWYNIDNNIWNVISSTIDLDIDNSSIILNDNILSLKLVSNDFNDNYQIKIRQRGPKGRNGISGDPFIELINTTVNFGSNEAVVLVDNDDYDIFYVRKAFNGLESPIYHLKPSQLVFDDQFVLTESNFASVSSTINSSKSIYRWKPEFSFSDCSELELPNWVPDPSCLKMRSDPTEDEFGVDKVDMDWISYLEDTENDPFGSCPITPNIKIANALDAKCCQEDFFICPNVGDGDCGIIQSGGAAISEDDPSTSISSSSSSNKGGGGTPGGGEDDDGGGSSSSSSSSSSGSSSSSSSTSSSSGSSASSPYNSSSSTSSTSSPNPTMDSSSPGNSSSSSGDASSVDPPISPLLWW